MGGIVLKIALVGSSGYVAKYILDRLEIEPEVEKVLRIDKNECADAFIDLQKADEFDYA